ncbi:MAG: phage major capsid protein [Chloroflexi bacterium]|nr:phage major capsid protein [Chloroflexota bacterium]
MATTRYTALLEERDRLTAEGEAVFKAAEDAGRSLNAEERTADDVRDARLKEIGAEIALEERRRARLVANGGTVPTFTGGHDRRADDPHWGFSSLAEMAIAVKAACRPGAASLDDRLLIGAAASPSNWHQEQFSDDGYMVPPAMREEIWKVVVDGGTDLYNLVNPEPTNSNSVDLLADETTPWGTVGIQAYWRAEGAVMTPSRLDTDARKVTVHQLYAFVLATEELLADAPRLNARLTQGAGDAIRFKASNSIMRGTGAGQPLGFLNAPGLITQAAEGGQTAGTIVTKNISKMFSRLLANSIPRAVWLANTDTIPQLMELAIGNQPVFTPPNAGFRDAPGGFLLGRPILFAEHCSTLGTVGDLCLVDPAGYYAAQRSAIESAQSIHLYFDYGIQAFRWTFRFGGQPFLSAPVSPQNGATTKGHFVTLAAR